MKKRGWDAFFGSWKGLALTGGIIGLIAPLLNRFGNPDAGLCVACFERDLAGGLGFHYTDGGQYIRPEIPGLVLGSSLSALFFREFRARSGPSAMIHFLLGVFAMIGALSFTGCPFGTLLRLAEGNLLAVVGLLGLGAGAFLGVSFIKAGFYLGRTARSSIAAGYTFPVIMLCILVISLLNIRTHDLSAPFRSWIEPASLAAPALISLAAGLIIGFFAQRSRFCVIGAFRDIFLIRNPTYLYGLASMAIVALLANLALGQFDLNLLTPSPEETENVAPLLWSTGGMVLAGLSFTLAGGCAVRQLILAGEGDGDAAVFVLGMLCGAALTYNFALMGRPACGTVGDLSTPGHWGIILGLLFCITIGLTMRIREEKDDLS